MAVTQFAFGCAEGGNNPPAMYFASATIETKTPSGASSATTAAAHASQNTCRVATDTAIYVAFGSSPTASSSAGFLVPANGVEYFRVNSGDKAAVITA